MAGTRPSAQSIFLAALKLATPAEQAAYVSGVCGDDPNLRAAVDALLAAHRHSENVLDAPPSGLEATAAYKPITEGPGTRIGPYKLLQQIGAGGFGVVFMAEQQEPVRRKVALKIIKPGMDSAQVIARFEAERQALALMDHPNIARVLDAGATDSGRPFFVMELVKGVPLTEYCDKNNLPAKQRLELLVTICHAVQHAHQKGIIHRDLKPSNILVTLHDGKPVPKVIDFGVAKATSQQLTEKTLFTAYGQMIGTPSYMSPEQAEMSGLDIDTRSDIYSLGVLLYELLTGTTPLEARRLRQAGYAEMRRIIREEEPPRPSTRLSSLGAELTAVASHRSVEPKKLQQLVSGDLDWIVMKALEKDRDRRYETPNSLAADIARYLHDDPVQARPPNAAYRLRKYLRKHRAGVLTAAALVVVLVLGVVVSAWQAVLVTAAGRAAQAEKDRALDAEQQARANEEKAKALEQKAEQKATEALALFGFVRSLANPARERALESDVQSELSFFDALEAAESEISTRFAKSPLAEAEIRCLLGDLYHAREDKRAVPQYERAIQLRRDALGKDADLTIASMNDLAWAYCYYGAPGQASSLYEQILATTQTKLGPIHPQALKSMINAAGCYFSYDGKAERADLHIKAAEQAIAERNARFGPQDLDTIALLVYLGYWSKWVGKPDRGVPWLEQAEQGLRPHLERPKLEDPAAVSVLNRLANAYASVGSLDRALPLYERYYEAIRSGARLEAGDTPRLLLQFDDTEIDRFRDPYPFPQELVEACEKKGQLDRCAPLLAAHLAVLRQWAPTDGRSLDKTLLWLGRSRMQQGKWAEAEAVLRELVALSEKRRPNTWYHSYVKTVLAGALLGQNHYAEAERLLLEGWEGMRVSGVNAPGHQIEALERLLHLYEAIDRKDEAAKWRKELEAAKAAASRPAKP